MCKNCYDDGNHEFVGMDICIYCGECKQLLLQPEFFRGADGEMHPKKGIVPMIEAERGPKGPIFGERIVKVRRDAVQGEEFIKFMNTHGFLICEPEFMDKLMQSQEVQNADS